MDEQDVRPRQAKGNRDPEKGNYCRTGGITRAFCRALKEE
jgi:hypothetical protein